MIDSEIIDRRKSQQNKQPKDVPVGFFFKYRIYYRALASVDKEKESRLEAQRRTKLETKPCNILWNKNGKADSYQRNTTTQLNQRAKENN